MNAARLHSSRRSDARQFCRRIEWSRRVTRQSHRQHSDCQHRSEDGICLEPAVEFAWIPQIVSPVCHGGPSLQIETSHKQRHAVCRNTASADVIAITKWAIFA
jgi:hypothetical protein